MNRTATQIITRALRATKVLGADQSAPAFALSDGLLALQAMLDAWGQDPHLAYAPDHPLPAFSDLSTPVSVPDGLIIALEYELALMLAPEHGQALDPRLAAMSAAALRNRRRVIATARAPHMVLESAALNCPTYNIETDE